MIRKSIPWAVIALIALLPGSRQALAEDGGGFSFNLDEIVLETIQTDQDTNSAKFQEYRDLRSGYRIPRLRLSGESADGNRTFDFRADNVDRRDARFTLDYDVAGKYSFTYDYNRIQHLFANDAILLYGITAPGRLEIPDPLQDALENFTGDPRDLIPPFQEAAQRVDLGLQRNRTHARLDVNKMDKLGFAVDVRHESRSGRRPYGGSFGFSNVIEIFEPTDYETTDVELSGAWNAQNGGLRFGVRHSDFNNDNSTLIWDNPFALNDASNVGSKGIADLAPDNDAGILFVDGKYKNASGWRVTATGTYSKLTQDDPLLPLTINTAIVGEDPVTGAEFSASDYIAASSANAEAIITSFYGNIAKQLGDNVEISVRYRYYDYDNNTPRLQIPGYVRFHSQFEDVPRITVPFAYSHDDVGIELDWQVNPRHAFTFSYDLKSWDRQFREIDSSDEDVFEVAYNGRPSERVNVRASWQFGDRTIGPYSTEAQLLSFVGDEETINNQPLLRKYDEAAREYDDYSLQITLFPSDAWSVELGYSGRKEDYKKSVFGLLDDETTHVNGEISYSPSESLSFFVFGDRADRDNSMRARQSGATLSTNPLDDWMVHFTEANDTWGAGLTADSSDRWHWEISYNWSKSDGKADFTTPPGGRDAVDIDNYEDVELKSAKLDVGFDVTKQAKVGLTYLYEDYTIDSFNLIGLMPYLPSTILLVGNNGNYQADIWGLYMKLGF